MTPNKNILGLRIQDFFEEDKLKAKEYECVICKKIFSDNFDLECNHCICNTCIKLYEKCPQDNNDILKEFNAFNGNFIGEELLNDLRVTCIFKEEGCNWSGIFEEFYSYHLNQCEYNKNKNNDEENLDIIIDGIKFEEYDDNMLNKKRKINHEEIKENNEELKFSKIINLAKSSYSIFHQNNLNNNLYLLPPEDEGDNNINNNEKDIGNILDKYFFENYNNILTIDSNLTKNIFPYYYYFTEPLDNSFNCKIEVVSRDINIKEISFGLTNINNDNYLEIISSRNNLFLFVIGDIIRILYDSKNFYINKENGKINRTIFFENKDNIRYYPTIILNNQNDILKVSHN